MGKMNKLMSRSKIAEVATVSSEMTTLHKELDLSEDLYLQSLFDRYTPLSDQISDAIKRDHAESDLDERDTLRDDHIRDIFYVVKGATRNPIQVIKDAGVKVFAVLAKYGLDIIDESYAVESAHLNSMVNDLSTEDMSEFWGEISGLKLLINQLKQTQIEFEAAQSALDDAISSDKENASATDIKKEIVTLINDEIVVHLRAMINVNPEMYGEFVRRTTEIINRNNVQVKKRCS